MKILFAAPLVCALTLSATAQAETYYVSDQLTITLRTGESTNHQIIRTLKSGTHLNITQTNEESGYSYAILEDGTEGWVLTRFLVTTPVAQDQLADAKARLQKLEKELKAAKTSLGETNKDRDSLGSNVSKLEQQNTNLERELKQIKEISANSLAINEDNQRLNSRIIQLETQIQSLEQENIILQDRSDRDWFIAGTGVILLGMVIGLLAPRVRMRKKANWNEL